MAQSSSITAARAPQALDDDTKVHAAGTFKSGSLRWGYFLVLNAIAGVIATAFFVAIFYADGIDPYMQGTYDWLLGHPGATSMMAFSPLACSLLVGYGYSQRARKRKAAAQRRAEAAGKTDESVETTSAGADEA
ncbi:MAG: hypothetical protein VB934_07945 [Polyangiaceae bacterium]